MIAKAPKPKITPRWRRLLALIPGYDCFATAARDDWFDCQLADLRVAFFEECLTHIEGALASKPFILEDWQRAGIGCLFGWQRRDPATGTPVRRYRKTLWFVPRKNGKTPLAAGICNCVMFCDSEPGAQGYLFAGSRDQAGLAFRHMKGQIQNEPELSRRAEIYGGKAGVQKRILYRDCDGFMVVQASEDETQHGGNPHIVLIDELHVQKDRDLVDAIMTSFASENRTQPLMVMITTSDFDRPSICNEMHKYASEVRDNGGNPDKPGYDSTFLPIIYEAQSGDDWKLPATWEKANPNLGVSVSRSYLETECKRAQEIPAYENTFKRLHLNMRTEQDVRLIPMDGWDQCGESFNEETLIGKECFGGLDLASREDLASFALIFPCDEDIIRVLVYSWCPEAKVLHRAKRAIPYDVWAKQGWLYATAGNRIDHRAIREKINELGRQFKVQQIAYDPRDATEIVQNLQDEDGFTLVEVTQTFPHMSSPTKELISRVKARTVRHNRNPVLRWAASNVAPYIQGKIPMGEQIGDHLDKVPIMPSKQKSADKIDPITALVLGLGRAVLRQSSTSVYETRGMITI